MRRSLVVAAATATMLLTGASTALAQDPAPDAPEFAPPAVTEVTDVASAEAFSEGYVAREADEFLNQSRRRVRVYDVQTSCLVSPILETRFGCVFTLKALVISRSRGWHDWDHKASVSSRGGDDRKKHKRHKPRIRIRNYGCLGALTIDGGPGVEPEVDVRFVECARIPRGDREVEAPAPVQ